MRPGKKRETQGPNSLLLFRALATIMGGNDEYNAKIPPGKTDCCLVTQEKSHAVSLEMSLNIPKGNDFADQIACVNVHIPVCVRMCDRHRIRAAYSEVT